VQNRSKLALGFLASAVLLSGSAFAAAPDYDNPLPTVIITDKIEAPTSGTFVFDPFPATTTMYLFRYTDAFSAFDYIDPGDASAASIKFLFAEFDDENDVTPNSARTLTINDTMAVTSIPSNASAFVSASFLNASPAGVADRLDFRNIDFSPGVFVNSDPGTSTGTVTGDNIWNGPQSRVVTLFIHSDDVPGAISAADMLVITKLAGPGEGDTLTDPAFGDPFDCFYSPADLSGWDAGALGQLLGVPFDGRRSTAPVTGTGLFDIPGFANVPAIGFNNPTLSGAATMSLSISSTLGQQGFANWQRQSGIGASDNNTLYRLRSTAMSSNAATKEWFRVTLGNGITNAQAGFFGQNPIVNPGLSTTATDFYTYLWSKQTGNQLAVIFDLIDQNANNTGFTGTGSDEFTISGVEICRADRADLGAGTMLLNVGAVPGSVASGQAISPAPSPTGFNSATNFTDLGAFNLQRPVTTTNTASARAVTYGTIGSPDPLDPFTAFASTTFADAFSVSEGALYAVDVWVSTNNAAATRQPELRIGVQVGSYNAYTGTTLDPMVLSVSNNAALSTQAKVYSNFFSPQFISGAPASTNAFLSVDFLELVDNIAAGVTVTIHQVTVWEWN
jgi:hypothetical protein